MSKIWGLILGLGLLVPFVAHADVSVSVDANAAVRMRNVDEHPVKFGLAGRLGYRIGGDGVVNVTPEAMFAWERFGDNDNTIRVMGGLRIAGGKIIQPSVFAHAGWGRHNFHDDHDHAFALDGGMALDFVAIPALKIGAQAAYNLINFKPDAFDYVTFGGHLTLDF